MEKILTYIIIIIIIIIICIVINIIHTIKQYISFKQNIYIVVIVLLCMEKRTTIQIKKKTLERIKTFKVVNKESYDELLNRILDEKIGKGKK